MKLLTVILLATSIAGLTSGMASAACPDATASIGGKVRTGTAKAGTDAPLETDAMAKANGTAKGGPVNKDGNTMPLANQEGGGDKDLATSQEDVAAQQKGDKTAAAKADENAKSDACKD
jgi:hypothetical protein